MKLRAQGFKPSNANRQAITKALDHRPNQAPLIEALQETLAYQRKLQAQMQNANAGQQPGYNFGVGQPPPGMGPMQPPGVPPDPGQTRRNRRLMPSVRSASLRSCSTKSC